MHSNNDTPMSMQDGNGMTPPTSQTIQRNNQSERTNNSTSMGRDIFAVESASSTTSTPSLSLAEEPAINIERNHLSFGATTSTPRTIAPISHSSLNWDQNRHFLSTARDLDVATRRCFTNGERNLGHEEGMEEEQVLRMQSINRQRLSEQEHPRIEEERDGLCFQRNKRASIRSLFVDYEVATSGEGLRLEGGIDRLRENISHGCNGVTVGDTASLADIVNRNGTNAMSSRTTFRSQRGENGRISHNLDLPAPPTVGKAAGQNVEGQDITKVQPIVDVQTSQTMTLNQLSNSYRPRNYIDLNAINATATPVNETPSLGLHTQRMQAKQGLYQQQQKHDAERVVKMDRDNAIKTLLDAKYDSEYMGVGVHVDLLSDDELPAIVAPRLERNLDCSPGSYRADSRGRVRVESNASVIPYNSEMNSVLLRDRNDYSSRNSTSYHDAVCGRHTATTSSLDRVVHRQGRRAVLFHRNFAVNGRYTTDEDEVQSQSSEMLVSAVLVESGASICSSLNSNDPRTAMVTTSNSMIQSTLMPSAGDLHNDHQVDNNSTEESYWEGDCFVKVQFGNQDHEVIIHAKPINLKRRRLLFGCVSAVAIISTTSLALLITFLVLAANRSKGTTLSPTIAPTEQETSTYFRTLQPSAMPQDISSATPSYIQSHPLPLVAMHSAVWGYVGYANTTIQCANIDSSLPRQKLELSCAGGRIKLDSSNGSTCEVDENFGHLGPWRLFCVLTLNHNISQSVSSTVLFSCTSESRYELSATARLQSDNVEANCTSKPDFYGSFNSSVVEFDSPTLSPSFSRGYESISPSPAVGDDSQISTGTFLSLGRFCVENDIWNIWSEIYSCGAGSAKALVDSSTGEWYTGDFPDFGDVLEELFFNPDTVTPSNTMLPIATKSGGRHQSKRKRKEECQGDSFLDVIDMDCWEEFVVALNLTSYCYTDKRCEELCSSNTSQQAACDSCVFDLDPVLISNADPRHYCESQVGDEPSLQQRHDIMRAKYNVDMFVNELMRN